MEEVAFPERSSSKPEITSKFPVYHLVRPILCPQEVRFYSPLGPFSIPSGHGSPQDMVRPSRGTPEQCCTSGAVACTGSTSKREHMLFIYA